MKPVAKSVVPLECTEILTDPHPMLHTVCRRDFTITRYEIEQMFALMRRHNGIGLAAPQVGIDARFFVTGWDQIFINPEIVEHSPRWQWSDEGCLSLPGKFVRVSRWSWVVMKTGERYDGLRAFVVQHEMDHLEGKLIA